MKIDDSTTWLEDALAWAGQETRYHVADALYCHLHNTGQALAGNTEENDVEWLRRELYRDHKSRRPGNEDIDKATDAERAMWYEIARVCIRVMPRLQQRIAHRLIELSKVMQDIERAERAAHQAKTRK